MQVGDIDMEYFERGMKGYYDMVEKQRRAQDPDYDKTGYERLVEGRQKVAENIAKGRPNDTPSAPVSDDPAQ